MKRVLLSIVAICLLAGQASADLTPLTLDKADALMLNQLDVTGGFGVLQAVTTDLAAYQNRNNIMQGEVGYYGFLMKDAEITIGADAGTLGISGSYSGFELFLANDNDDDWEVALYVEGQGNSGFTSISPGTGSVITWNFLNPVTFTTGMDIGFIVRNVNYGDAFHISAVPVPVGIVLGVLGLGVAGLKLRKFV